MWANGVESLLTDIIYYSRKPTGQNGLTVGH